MVWRSLLSYEKKSFLPLYRERQYDQNRRKITKYIMPSVWYSGEQIKDPYRNMWKGRIKRNFNRSSTKLQRMKESIKKKETNHMKGPKITTTLFVPSSVKFYPE